MGFKGMTRRGRESLSAGAASALRVVVFLLLFAPVQCLIDWALDGPGMNWGSTAGFTAVVAGSAFAISAATTFLDSWRRGRIDRASEPSFPATSFISGVCGAMLLTSGAMSIGLHMQAEAPWLQILALGFTALAWFAWPRTIHCDEAAVWQRTRWGTKTAIPYVEIEAISVGGDGTTTVLGPNSFIEHTPYHTAPEQFHFVLSTRSGRPVY